MNRGEGGPAFPAGSTMHQEGMSIRDFFAGMVVVGLAAGHYGGLLNEDQIAGTAYRIADAMIVHRGGAS